MPIPCGLVVWKAWNNRSRLPGLSPEPESATPMSTAPASARMELIHSAHDALSLPLIASTAFIIRLRTTCCSWTRSPSSPWPVWSAGTDLGQGADGPGNVAALSLRTAAGVPVPGVGKRRSSARQPRAGSSLLQHLRRGISLALSRYWDGKVTVRIEERGDGPRTFLRLRGRVDLGQSITDQSGGYRSEDRQSCTRRKRRGRQRLLWRRLCPPAATFREECCARSWRFRGWIGLGGRYETPGERRFYRGGCATTGDVLWR